MKEGVWENSEARAEMVRREFFGLGEEIMVTPEFLGDVDQRIVITITEFRFEEETKRYRLDEWDVDRRAFRFTRIW